MAKKVINKEIANLDEAALIMSVYEQDNPPMEVKTVEKEEKPLPEQTEKPKEESKRKRKSQDYESLFISESTVTARLGKTVYIRQEYHDRILKIIQVVGNNEVSLFSYIDNVLTHHFEHFQEDISQAYKSRISNELF